MVPPALAMQPPSITAHHHPFRWLALVLLSLAMFGNYYVYDCVGPLADALRTARGFTDSQLGTLNGVYSVPNVFMVLVGGVLVDRLGAGRATTMFAAMCVLGAVVTAMVSSFVGMTVGRLLFGLGAESMIVAITTSLGLWFGKKELGLAMGLNLMVARAGSYSADMSPKWFAGAYASGVDQPLWIAAGLMIAGLVFAFACQLAERRAAHALATSSTPPDRIRWREVLTFGRQYWLIVGVCVAFYSAIFPFRSTFAVKYFVDAFGLSNDDASELNSYVFLASIFATPTIGWLAGAIDRRSLLHAIGALLLPLSFVVLLTGGTAGTANVLIGIAFSTVPAVLWPLVADLAPKERLGTAYGLLTMLQNIGLAAFNFAIGAMNDAAGASAKHVAGYQPMLWTFLALGTIGAVFAGLLAMARRGR